MQRSDLLSWANARIRQAGLPRRLRSTALRQLEEYFSGERRAFSLPVKIRGTSFQRAVWKELRCIPYGQTITYGELALRIGHPRAARAVGSALRKNPLPVIVPCHRVIPAVGGIGRYAGGSERKRALLRHERIVTHLLPQNPPRRRDRNRRR